jgi:hypothetical protein
MAGRRPWAESWEHLKARGVRVGGSSPEECDRPEPGVPHGGPCVLAGVYEEVDLEDLTLPRTLVEDCRFQGVSFRNTILRMSCLAGNDFLDCDFTGAVLTCADLRDADLFGCRFVDCTLTAADLRGAKLTGCDFTGADLNGARMDRALKDVLALSDRQRDLMVDWREPGEE